MARPKKSEKPAINIEDFKYLSDLRIPCPQLVLGIKIPREAFRDDYPIRNYNFRNGRQWIKIAHIAGGQACHQHYFIGTLLNSKIEAIVQGGVKLSEKWYGSNIDSNNVDLGMINQYSKDLAHFIPEASCMRSWKSFEEGIYPMDVESIGKVASDKLPSNLDELIEFKSGMDRAIGAVGRWSLVILGKNST